MKKYIKYTEIPRIPEDIIKEINGKIYYYIREIDRWVFCRRMKYELSIINLTVQDWYNKNILNSDTPSCPYCGKPRKFIDISHGYRTTCGDRDCISKEYTRVQRVSKEKNEDRWIKQSNTIKELYKNPEYREKWETGRKSMLEREDYHENLSKSLIKTWESPSEEMINAQRSRGIKSKTYSPYEDKDISFDSTWEEKFFNICIKDMSIKIVIRSPFTIKYINPIDNKFHNYIPDFFIEYKNGTKELIEVKPKYLLNDIIVKSKEYSAIEYCKNNNINYRFVTEDDIF